MPEMLTSRRNNLFREIKEAGLDPAEFKWVDSQEAKPAYDEEGYPALVHIPSGYYFIFGEYPRSTAWSPGTSSVHSWSDARNWAAQDNLFKQWLSCLKVEISEPDLWEASSFGEGIELLDPIAETQDTPFTSDEVEKLAESIESIKEHLREQDLINEANQVYVFAQLDYLKNQSTRQGRWTWVQLAIGVLVPLAVTLHLSSDQARALFKLFKQLVGHIINVPLSLPLS